MTFKNFTFLGTVALVSFVVAGTAVWMTSSRPAQEDAAVNACRNPVRGEQVTIPAGTFAMGSDEAYPEERPRRAVTVAAFRIDRHEVTNAEFAEFVAATGYVTMAERGLDPAEYPDLPPELRQPGSMVFIMPEKITSRSDVMQWWAFVPGADWRHPAGPGSSIDGKDDHPVVQVSPEDAEAYFERAQCYDRLGKQAEAERDLAAARRLGLRDAD